MTKATNLDEARKGAALIHAPGLNVMYADRDGNIAWWPSASLVIRPEGVNSKLILDGSSGHDDPIGFYAFEENPKAENPTWNYVYSANNQPIKEGFEYYPGYYVPEDRARRIVTLIEEKNDWTVEEVKEMLLDTKSENSPEVVQSILGALSDSKQEFSAFENECIELLKSWDGSYGVDEKAALIYNKMLYHIMFGAMSDELGKDLFDIYNGTHLMKRSIQPILENSNSKWWDDITTQNNEESQAVIIVKAFKTSISELVTQFSSDSEKWKWGDVHTLEHGHSFGTVPALKKYFNVGPFSVAGNTETINNYMYKLEEDGTYEVLAGPSTRRIVDFADIDGNSWSILPTGQSGNVLSLHYADQAEMHAKGEFRRVLTDREEIITKAKNKSIFQPK